MPPAPSITPSVYSALLHAYRTGGDGLTDRVAGGLAGCSREVARKAYTGHYAKALPWAPAIRDVVAGIIAEPVMPRVWPPPPVRPKPAAPDALPPSLAIVRPLRPAKEPADKPRPGLSAPPERSAEPQDVDASADPATAGLAAMALHRGALTGRARAIARSGPYFDAYFEWLVKGMVRYAESMSGPDAVVSLGDLLDAAQIAGIVAGTMDKIGAALERVVAAERKLNPPTSKPPTDKPAPTPDESKRRLQKQAARWSRLAADPNPPELPVK